MMTVLTIAPIYYEVRAQYRRSLGLNDPPSWENVDYSTRTRVLSDVTQALVHLSLGPERAHSSWARKRRTEGYVFGVPRNSTDKRSVLLRPYHTLSKDRRMDDALLYGTVRACMNAHIP